MFCNNCGKEQEGTEKFCHQCGTPLQNDKISDIPKAHKTFLAGNKITHLFKSRKFFLIMLCLIITVVIYIFYNQNGHNKAVYCPDSLTVNNIPIDSVVDEQPIYLEYNSVRPFNDGLARVELNGCYGFINIEGKEVVKCAFKDAGDFHEGRAWVKIQSKYGFVDVNDNMIVQSWYDKVGDFHEGMAWVCLNRKSGFIDQSGNNIIPCEMCGGTGKIAQGGGGIVLDYMNCPSCGGSGVIYQLGW